MSLRTPRDRAQARARLLATKLHPPEGRRRLVARDRLVDRLVAGEDAPLTVLVAPAGWGKTTLLTEWRRRSSHRLGFAWVSLDADDTDPARFWTYVVHALADVDSSVLPVVDLVERLSGDVAAQVIPALVNHLQAADTRPTVLILDDYHLLDSSQIDEQLTALIEHAPARLHLALATRQRPDLPIARLRVRGSVNEVHAQDLRFTAAETATLLRETLGVRITDADVVALQARTEGWVAALQLAALSLRSKGRAAEGLLLTGENEHLADYLVAEVLDSLDEDLRTFLLQTSVLSRMSAPLCNAVTARTDGEFMLRQVERRNLFIFSLDDRRQWFRYHHLFRETLRQELARARPAELAVLHQRAAAWYESSGLETDAIKHAFASADLDLAQQLVSAHWNAHYNLGRLTTVSSWLDGLGEDRVRADVWLSAARVFIWADQGRLDELDAWLEVTNDGPSEYPYAVLRALHRFKCGDLVAAANELATAEERRTADEPFWPTVEECLRGAVGYWTGDADGARSALSRAGFLARSNGNLAGLTYSLGYLALLAIDDSNWSEAKRILDEIEPNVATGSDLTGHFVATLPHLAAGRLLAATGDAGAATSSLEQAVAVGRTGAGRLELLTALVALARQYESHGDRAAAAPLLSEAKALLRRCREPGRGVALLADQPGVRRSRSESILEPLTARETAVLLLLPSALSLREIANSLYVSHNTAKTHTRSLYRKLQVTTREDAIERARDEHLI